MRKMMISLIVCFLLLNSTAAFAETDSLMAIGDLVISRPLGIVATVIGSAVFIVSLPFALTSGSVKDTADVLVGEPFRFTFKRPLGDFRQYRAYSPTDRTQKDQTRSDKTTEEEK